MFFKIIPQIISFCKLYIYRFCQKACDLSHKDNKNNERLTHVFLVLVTNCGIWFHNSKSHEFENVYTTLEAYQFFMLINYVLFTILVAYTVGYSHFRMRNFIKYFNRMNKVFFSIYYSTCMI